MRIKTIVFFLLYTALTMAQVKLQFVTVNQYGNNLYLDNVTAGTRFSVDAGISSINNIYADTNYAVSSEAFTLAPRVTVINSGKQNINTPFNVTMTILPGVYSSVKSVSSLNSGQVQEVVFDNLTIVPNQAINISVTSSLAGDENQANNTLNQYTIYLPGVTRNVMLEEWTSSTCGPCASSNPTIDAFVSSHFDSIAVVKYHMNWPSPGNDPMYLYNPTQATDRRNYYGINAVPSVIMDGVMTPSGSFAAGLPTAFYARKAIGAPLSISVTNTRLADDTIQADVQVHILAPMKYGNYYLRVQAVERWIHYNTAPGSNHETDFYDVFRKAYPNSLGTPLSTSPGTYVYTFKYKLDLPTWVDTAIYTNAFVQDDISGEILNAGKSRTHVLETSPVIAGRLSASAKPERAPSIVRSDRIKSETQTEAPKLNSAFYYNMFEGKFSPNGWKIINPDKSLTFSQYPGVNGPTLGGTKAATVQFYDYSSTGRSDTMYSDIFTNLTAADTLSFDWAYAQYESEQDRLIVKLSKDGGLTYPYTIFDKAGSSLATAPATTNSFVPTASQWKTFMYGLSQVFQTQITQPVSVKSGWNILSVPVAALDMTAATLFPNANSAFYGYNNGYNVLTTLSNGKGFWARFGAANTYQLTGGVVNAPVTVTAGWNLIGGYDRNTAVSAITSVPANIVNSYYYSYDNGYASAQNLVPGQGYWVRVTQDGVLNLNASTEKADAKPTGYQTDPQQIKITLNDKAGRHAALFLSRGNESLSSYDLPPLPPEGIFDARFVDGRFVNRANESGEIKIQSAQYPLSLTVENGTIEIQDKINGEIINRRVKSGEELIIADERINYLTVKSVSAPAQYMLEQNYPNPFNPATLISYHLPSASYVKLTVYDALGKEISRLVDCYQDAGSYHITFNAAQLASGVYFYQIKAGSYLALRKMLIIK